MLSFISGLDSRIFYFIEKQPRWLIVAIGYLLTLFLEIVHYLCGHQTRLAVFYCPALFLLAWFVNVRSAVALAGLSSMSWFVLDYNVRSLGIIGHAWDALARFIFFAVFIFGVSAYKRERTFAREDHLTKVANSQYLAELAGLEIERCRRYRHPFSIVYMDVDDFKTVNDTLGHQAGDALLSTVAQTIRKNVRKSDVVARLGGDEFAILLPETDSEQASSSVSKLQKILLDTMREGAWPCTFSFGLATFSRAPATFDEMISRADRLMYEAKSGGKNTVRSGLY